jgi:hypothetical protein
MVGRGSVVLASSWLGSVEVSRCGGGSRRLSAFPWTQRWMTERRRPSVTSNWLDLIMRDIISGYRPKRVPANENPED